MIQRYADARITEIFSPQAVIERWWQIELVAMRAMGHHPGPNLCPGSQAVADEESVTKHDVVGFLRAWLKSNPDNKELQRWVHYGLTSSNVVDCGLAMALENVNDVVRGELSLLLKALGTTQRRLVAADQMARTHGQYAESRSASHVWRVWYDGLERSYGKLHRVRDEMAVGSLAGPVGVSQAMDPPAETRALRELGLRRVLASQLTPRDGLASWAQLMALIATQCEAIASQVWLWAQSGIAEVYETPTPGQVGSSAMPHKRNPIRCENIRGLARMARAQVDPILQGVVQWSDHDLAHSSTERLAVPDLAHLICAVLRRTIALLHGLVFDRNQMERNIRTADLDGAHTHHQLLQMVLEGTNYVDAHAHIASVGVREETGNE